MRLGLVLIAIACVGMLVGTLCVMLAPFATPAASEPPRAAPQRGSGATFEPDPIRRAAGADSPRSAGPAADPPRATGSPTAARSTVPSAAVSSPVQRPAVREPRAQQQRRFEAAFADAARVLDSDPMNPGALRAACDAALALQRWPEACALLERRVALDPDDADLRFEYASVLLRLSHWSSAARELAAVAQSDPQHARAWYNLALAQQSAGRLADAERAWSRAIELLPDDADARAHRGELRLDLHDWSGASDDLAAALILAPDDAAIALNLGLALARSGQMTESQRVLLDLHARRPRDVRVMNRLAELAWSQSVAASGGDAALRTQAAEWCRRSLAIDPDQPSVAELLARAGATRAP
ncbi:MAG: tetratricopeptide repeat protein [Phycisphaerae bacterium]